VSLLVGLLFSDRWMISADRQFWAALTGLSVASVRDQPLFFYRRRSGDGCAMSSFR